MYEHIDSVIAAVARIFSLSDKLTLTNVHPAQIVASIQSTNLMADARLLASEIGVTLSIVFFAVIIYIAIRRGELKRAVPPAATPEQVMSAPVAAVSALTERWGEIMGHLDSPRENDWKSAVTEADKLVDTALKQAGFGGESFGDRLTNIQVGTLTSLDGLWWAHRIRNRIAHEMDYFLRYTEARQAISYYEAALTELQLL